MKVEKDKVVTFHYRLSQTNGAQLEDSRTAQPMVYLHGHKGLFPVLEAALEGKKVGDTCVANLTAEEAYGQRDDQAIQRVSINHVMRQGKKKVVKFQPGMLIYLNTKEGPQPAVVLKAGLKTLDVDLNHPLAGQDLSFDIEIIDIRDASEEELSHGHVHGDGGVHH